MKERPIIFTGESVRAILAGRKSQTRRVVKPQAPLYVGDLLQGDRIIYPVWREGEGGDVSSPIRLPYGEPGDRLWVRETWVPSPDGPIYRVTENEHGITEPDDAPRWRSPIHMPRWASRITLRVTDVRVERVQDISEADAIAEGLHRVEGDGTGPGPGSKWTGTGYHGAGRTKGGVPTYHTPGPEGGCACAVGGPSPAQCALQELWRSINTKPGTTWDANPWVWVVGFERMEAA